VKSRNGSQRDWQPQRGASDGGATELSLCDPDREFSICIL